jgi:hypothetical protein
MRDDRKSLKFAAASSNWTEHHCTRKHAHHFGCPPSARRRTRWAIRWQRYVRIFAMARHGVKLDDIG